MIEFFAISQLFSAANLDASSVFVSVVFNITAIAFICIWVLFEAVKLSVQRTLLLCIND